MHSVGVGLIRTGFMNKLYALARRSGRCVMGDLPSARPVALAETPLKKARTMAARLGFARTTDQWCDLVTDPEISITTPNGMPMPKAA